MKIRGLKDIVYRLEANERTLLSIKDLLKKGDVYIAITNLSEGGGTICINQDNNSIIFFENLISNIEYLIKNDKADLEQIGVEL